MRPTYIHSLMRSFCWVRNEILLHCDGILSFVRTYRNLITPGTLYVLHTVFEKKPLVDMRTLNNISCEILALYFALMVYIPSTATCPAKKMHTQIKFLKTVVAADASLMRFIIVLAWQQLNIHVLAFAMVYSPDRDMYMYTWYHVRMHPS
jgi:hypothetical protein